jgi:hypothetical protein
MLRGKAQESHDGSVFEAGDLVSVVTDDGKFGVVKILAVDSNGVHVRLYVQRYEERPEAAQIEALDTAPFGPEHEQPFSAGHLPLSGSSFAGWEPEIVSRGHQVEAEELEGYRLWEEAQGGYF